MHRQSSNLGFAAFHALLMIAATLLAAGGARAAWSPFAAPLLLALGLLGADWIAHRRLGRRLPSAGAAILAATILIASGILFSPGVDPFAAFVPMLACAAVAPVLLGDRARAQCRGVR